MKYVGAILLLLVCSVAAACPGGQTCLSWKGDGSYTDDKPIPSTFVVTYTVWNGAKGGPYTTLYAYNGAPTQVMSVQFKEPVQPKTCFVVTATADSPDDKGVLKPATSAYTAEVCDKVAPPAPTDGRIEAPTDGSIEF